MKKIAILGGGISGLSCAHYLLKFGKLVNRSDKIILIEAGEKVGGWLQTHKSDDEVVHELGPRSIRASGLNAFNTLLMVEELGLEQDVLKVTSKDPPAQKRWIYLNNQLYTLPNRLKHLFFKTPPFSRPLISSILQDWRTGPLNLDTDDITVHDFMTARFSQEVADYLFSPMCRGIAAGDYKKLSMKSMFPPIFRAEREKGSVIKGMLTLKPPAGAPLQEINKSPLVRKARLNNWNIWSLRNGLNQLPKQILDNLRNSGANIEVHLGHKVDHIMFKEDGSSVVHVSSARSVKPISVDHIFSALPSKKLAECISSRSYPILHKTLDSISSATVAVVNMEYQGTVIPRDMGFGVLTPSFIDSPLLGIVFDSCCFPAHDGGKDITRFTAMMGGEWFEHYFGDPVTTSFDDLSQKAIEGVRQLLGVKEDPIKTIVNVHKECIPQYYLGHASKVETIKRTIAENRLNLDLLGNSFCGLGVNDCILDARLKVENYFELTD